MEQNESSQPKMGSTTFKAFGIEYSGSPWVVLVIIILMFVVAIIYIKSVIAPANATATVESTSNAAPANEVPVEPTSNAVPADNASVESEEPLLLGDTVLAEVDSSFYPAQIDKVNEGGFEVKFDDGSVATLPSAKVYLFDWQAGTEIQCDKSEGKYYPATIRSITKAQIEIDYDDGNQELTTISHCRQLAQ